jgi:nucleotide-binding universal stress UspA family protein
VSVFRRSIMTTPGTAPPTCRRPSGRAKEAAAPTSRQDDGPILVAVDGREPSRRALEWAAAEASARECVLRIVNVFNWNIGVNACAAIPILVGDAGALTNAELIVNQAADRAREVDPKLCITTHAQEGSVGAAVLRVRANDALIVLGRREQTSLIDSFTGSASRHIVRHSSCPVTVIKLLNESSYGPSAGRVVAAVDDIVDQPAVLGFAFRAALRRGIGLTVLHSVGANGRSRVLVHAGARRATEHRPIEARLREFCIAFPEVEVRLRLVAAPPAREILAESAGAALVVVGSDSDRPAHCHRSHALGHDLLRYASSPVTTVSGD